MSECISYLRLTIDCITILVLHTHPHTLIAGHITRVSINNWWECGWPNLL